MELKINLNDHEDIAAGASLLQHLLTGSTCTGQGKCHEPPKVERHELTGTIAAGLTGGPLPEHPNFGCVTRPLYDEFKAAQAADARDPAIVFGGAVVPAPLLVPSTAVAAPQPTAPVAPMPTLPQVATAPVPPAPTPAVAAVVPTAPVAPSSLAAADSLSAALAADAQKLAGLGQSGAAVLPNGVELDAKGMPWDSRIHSSGKTLIKDGTWRYKGGVPPERIAAVEAELRGGPAPLALPPVAPIVTTQAPAAPVGANLPTTSADVPQTFEQIMPRITAAVTAGKLQPGAIQAACSALGLASIVQLQTSPAFVPQVWALLGLEG